MSSENNRINIRETVWRKEGIDGSICHDNKYNNDKLIDVIAFLQEKLAEIPEQYRENAEIEIDTVDGYEGLYHVEIIIYYSRPETDEEMNIRLNLENQRRKEIEQQELAQLKALKEKYNG